jgi:subtilisin family serine protease
MRLFRYPYLIFLFLALFALQISAQTDCNCTGDSKLINSDQLYNQIERGAEKVKVIINLKQPQMLREKKVNWRSKESKNRLHTEVKNVQEKVLKKFGKKEFSMRYRFENQAAFSCEISIDALDKILLDPNVVSIEPVEYLHKHLAQGIPLINGSLYRSNYNGQGVSVAICDTGVDYNHPMLGGGNFPNTKVIGGYDFGDNDANPFPLSDEPHGTSCAGIAAGDLGTTGDYVGGVAYNSKIYALKVEDSSGDMMSDKIAASWDWCVTHQYDDPDYPIMVISVSLGSSTGYSSHCDNLSYATSANNAAAAGICIVVSAGNDGYCDKIASPACLSNAISVGGVYDSAFGTYRPCIDASSCADKTADSDCDTGYYATDAAQADMVTSYSNVASILDVFAPSNKTHTLDIVGSTGYSSGDYSSSFGGTSAAAPYTAGTIACLQQAAKELTGSFLTPAQVRAILTSTGDSVTDTKVAITKPRINLGNAIDSLHGCYSAKVGTGTTSWQYPMHTGSADNRTQVIYLASQIGTAGTISALQLYVSTVPSSMSNFTIRMKHTPLIEFPSSDLDSNWTTIYQSDEIINTKGWRLFTFNSPFDYNGLENLMVDFSFNNTSKASSSGYCYSSTPGGYRTVYAYSNNTYGDPLDWNEVSSPNVYRSTYVPNVIFTIRMDSLSAPALNAEPNFTSGLCNRIYWSSVPNADTYFAEYSTDSNFSVADVNTGWITDANYQFCSLTNGQTYWYRVKAKNNFFNIVSDWSNAVSSRQCATIGDFQPDCIVDALDLAVIADQWLISEGTLTADIAPQPNGDGTVNFLDLAELALHWMQ